VTSGIGTYDYGSGSEPAIFTSDMVPEDASTPFIRITAIGGFLDGRDRSKRGGVRTVDVALWGSKSDSDMSLRDLAETLWFTLDRATITSTAYDEIVYCLAEPPRNINDRDGFPGYVVSCRILVRKE